MKVVSDAPSPPLFLIGFMASGKTTVGRIVAARTGWRFHDLDQVITDAAGRSVARIFADEGEAGFRRREGEALREATRLQRAVIATGGGAACNDENLGLMLSSGRVINLQVTADEVMRRAGAGARPGPHIGRPLLTAEGAVALWTARQPFYARAHHSVDTVGKSPEAVAGEVLGLIEANPS